MTNTKQSFWNRNIITLLGSRVTSDLGDIFYQVAIGFWVYAETGSMALMGVMASIGLFVNMFLNPVGGVIVDRLNRKNLLIFGDLAQAGLMLLVGFIALSKHLTIPIVFVVAFLVSLAGSFYSPAVMTVMLDMIDKSQIVQAQSSFSGLTNLIRLVGKGLSGVLVITLGVPLMIIFNGLSNLIAAILIWTLKIKIKHDPKDKITIKSIYIDLLSGAKLSFTMPGLNLLLICAILANFFGAGYLELLIPISFLKGLSETQYGLFTMSNTAAALLGAFILSFYPVPKKYKMFLFVFSFVAAAVFVIFGFLSYGFYSFTIFFFIGELFSVIGNTLLTSTLMIAAPEDKRATIFGFLSSFSIGGIALSTLTYGFLSNIYSIITISIVGTILSTLCLVPLFISPQVKNLITIESN